MVVVGAVVVVGLPGAVVVAEVPGAVVVGGVTGAVVVGAVVVGAAKRLSENAVCNMANVVSLWISYRYLCSNKRVLVGD